MLYSQKNVSIYNVIVDIHLQNDRLSYIGLNYSKQTHFFSSQENVSIHKMGLAMSGLAVEGARHVCTLLTSNSSILDLDLTCTRLTDDAAFLLGKMLAVNETLQVLRVRTSKICF